MYSAAARVAFSSEAPKKLYHEFLSMQKTHAHTRTPGKANRHPNKLLGGRAMDSAAATAYKAKCSKKEMRTGAAAEGEESGHVNQQPGLREGM